ncbi:MAG: response regulator [Planctomycetes bacterium]|nr:response regulator [Planctomycetota bacterium]
MIAEDDPGIALALEMSLRAKGYVVAVARTGAEAIESLRRNPPDGVILDIMLPGRHGFSILQDVRDDPALSRVRVVVVSAKSYPADVKKATELGAAAYLVKPFEMASLLKAVKDHVG